MTGAASRAIAIAAAIAAAALSMSACAALPGLPDMRTLPVDPASPVAADVERAERITGPVPSFASIPPKPTDMRPAAVYKAEVTDVVQDRRALSQWAAANPEMNTDTEGFAAAQRAKLAEEQPVPAEREKELEAFAKKLRDAAQAPNPK